MRTRERDVADAAKLMDKAQPNWFKRIVWERLQMQDPCNCIAGQSGLDWQALDRELETKYPTVSAPFADPDLVPFWRDEVLKRRRAS